MGTGNAEKLCINRKIYRLINDTCCIGGDLDKGAETEKTFFMESWQLFWVYALLSVQHFHIRCRKKEQGG